MGAVGRVGTSLDGPHAVLHSPVVSRVDPAIYFQFGGLLSSLFPRLLSCSISRTIPCFSFFHL